MVHENRQDFKIVALKNFKFYSNIQEQNYIFYFNLKYKVWK